MPRGSICDGCGKGLPDSLGDGPPIEVTGRPNQTLSGLRPVYATLCSNRCLLTWAAKQAGSTIGPDGVVTVPPSRCRGCNGAGVVIGRRWAWSPWPLRFRTCPACDGAGTVRPPGPVPNDD